MRRKKSGPAAWHVYARGARRLELFRDPEDYQEFSRLLGLFLRSAGCVLWAFALMSNHYHLVLYCSSDQLTILMRSVNHQYALYHNRKYLLSGHLLEGPYKNHLLKSPFLILRKIAYVLLNPFKAGLVAEPDAYPWTCLPAYRSSRASAPAVDLNVLWTYLGLRPDIGRQRFETAFAMEKAKPPGKRRDPLTALEVQQQEFEWLLDHARERAADLLGEDPITVACFWGKLAGIPPRAMARHLGLQGSGAVRSLIYRFRQRLAASPEMATAFPLP